MGAWGPGNFENDAALDMVEHVLEVTTAEIAAFCNSDRVRVEDLDAVMACVAIHLALHEHCNASGPDAEIASALREKILRVYDQHVDSLKPEPDYKVARRTTLVETLGRYDQAASTAA